MIDADALMKMYRINIGVIQRQTEGLTHEDSLIQPPFRGNCLNWVLGHILSSRAGILKLVGADPVWSDKERECYAQGSEPITEDGEGVIRLEKILANLEESQKRLMEGLSKMSVEDFDKPAPGRDSTVGDALAFLFFHESYHTGQTEYLRQLAGKDDKVI